MLQQERADDYVIATGETRPLTHFVEQAFACLGLDSSAHVSSNRALRRPIDISLSRANPTKGQQGLGWKARYRMDDVVRMMVEGFRG